MIMPRPKGKATTIAYKILGKPQEKISEREKKLQKRILKYNTRKVR